METSIEQLMSEKDFLILKTSYLFFGYNVYLEFLEKFSLKYDLSILELSEAIENN